MSFVERNERNAKSNVFITNKILVVKKQGKKCIKSSYKCKTME